MSLPAGLMTHLGEFATAASVGLGRCGQTASALTGLHHRHQTLGQGELPVSGWHGCS